MNLGASVFQTSGIISGIIDFFKDLFANFTETLKQLIITPLVVILYGLQLGFFYLIDCVQGVFRSMAGLSVYYYQGEQREGDLVMSMLMDQTIVTIFWAVLIVAIMLLFVTTIVAVIRSEFSDKNAKGPIIAKSIKAIAYFAVVPVACLLGVWISNVFLRSFDKATNLQASDLSTTVFFAAAHDANRVRNGDDTLFEKIVRNPELLKAINASASDDRATIATKIDQAFLSGNATRIGTFDIDGLNYMAVMGTPENAHFDHHDMVLVYYFYDLFGHYNFLIGYAGGGVAAVLLLQSCLALIQRLYELSLLFVISPAFIAFMPLDDGSKYKKWCGQFVRRVGMAYGPIIGLNLMFIILSRLQDVNIFDPSDAMGSLFNSIMQCVFMIVGLVAVRDFSKLISGLIDSDDAADKGKALSNNVMETGQKMAGGTIVAAKMGYNLAAGGAKSVANRGKIKESKSELNSANIAVDNTKAKLDKAIAGGNAKEIEEAQKDYDSAVTAQKTAKENYDDTKKGTLQGSLGSMREGFQKKGLHGVAEAFEDTSFGKNYQKLAKYAGMDKYLTVKGRDKAAEDGASFFGELPVYRDAKGNYTDRAAAKKSWEKAKEDKDREKAAQDAQQGYDAQAQAIADKLGPLGGNGGSGSAAPAVTAPASASATATGVGIPGFANLEHVYKADSYMRREEERLDDANKEKKKLEEYVEDADTGEMVRRARKKTDKGEERTGRELDRMSRSAYDKKVAQTDNAIDEYTKHIEDKRAELRGENIENEAERKAYVESAQNLGNFQALADMIAQAIANAQMKTKTTFDPGTQIDVRNIKGQLKLDSDQEIRLQQDIVEHINSIADLVSQIFTTRPKK